jgi:hypothetical protein
MEPIDRETDRKLSQEAKLVRTNTVLDSSIEDEQVVLNTDSEMYYGLNPVGGFLWEQLEEPRTVMELVEVTAEEFDVASSECRADVRSFLVDLLEADLVEPT